MGELLGLSQCPGENKALLLWDDVWKNDFLVASLSKESVTTTAKHS